MPFVCPFFVFNQWSRCPYHMQLLRWWSNSQKQFCDVNITAVDESARQVTVPWRIEDESIVHCSLIFQLDVLPWGLYTFVHCIAFHYISLHFITFHYISLRFITFHYMALALALALHSIPYRCDSFKASPVFPQAPVTRSAQVTFVQDTSCWKMVPFEHFKQKEVPPHHVAASDVQATSKKKHLVI